MEAGVAISLQELIALRASKKNVELPLKKQLLLSGEKLTSLRGRGIELDTIREYQAGDDIRNMAWRVTARNLKPYIKIYQEEKERPVWLAIDLSPSLFFGTRRMFKSVRSIIEATKIGWHSLQKRERIGAILGTQKPFIYLPKTGEKNFLNILNSFAKHSHFQADFNQATNLKNLFLSLQQHFRSHPLIYLFSDFFQLDHETEKFILYFSKNAQIILNFIYDPFEAEAPFPHLYQVTNGYQKKVFDMQNAQNRKLYRLQFQKKLNYLTNFAKKNQLTFNLHCTDTEWSIKS